MTDERKEGTGEAGSGEAAKPKKPAGGSVQAKGVPGFQPKNSMKPTHFSKGPKGGGRPVMKLSPRGR